MKILMNAQNKVYISSAGKALKATEGGYSFIIITSSVGSTLTCGSQTYTLTGTETSHTFKVDSNATYTCTASLTGYETATGTITVTTDDVYSITLTPTRLPAEYQEVEYLQSSGEQYIDTGIKAVSGISWEISYSLITNLQCGLIGARTSSVRFWNIIYSSLFEVGIGQDHSISSPVPVISRTYVHKLITDNNGWTAYYDNVQVASGSDIADIDGNIYLFKINAVSGSSYTGVFSCHYLKLYDSTSTVTRNLIPCYRKSDSKPGMYDTVTDTFFTNANSSATTDFTVGPDV